MLVVVVVVVMRRVVAGWATRRSSHGGSCWKRPAPTQARARQAGPSWRAGSAAGQAGRQAGRQAEPAHLVKGQAQVLHRRHDALRAAVRHRDGLGPLDACRVERGEAAVSDGSGVQRPRRQGAGRRRASQWDQAASQHQAPSSSIASRPGANSSSGSAGKQPGRPPLTCRQDERRRRGVAVHDVEAGGA